MKKLIGVRGVPGSGKSTTARRLKKEYEEQGFRVDIFSTDDFWGDPYNFVPAKIREAHLWNQNRALVRLIEIAATVNPTIHPYCQPALIIIDNTNVSAWELRPYIKPALQLGFEVEIIEPSTPWAFDAEECAKKTVHGVPVETIRSMIARWEKDLTPDKCLVSLAPWEKAA